MYPEIGLHPASEPPVYLDFSLLRAKIGKLIDDASDALERDRAVARLRLDEALHLLNSAGSPGRDEVSQPSRGTRSGLAPWQIRRIEAYTETHCDEEITIADLAAVCRLSVSYFSVAFRRSFGVPPGQMLTRLRVQRAQALMRATALPLSQIALDCGFCDQSHLSRQFRRVTGVTPQRWRRDYTGDPVPALALQS